MAKRLIYVGQDDDVSDLAGKVQAADAGDDVGLVVPTGAQAFQTPLNLRLLRSVAMKRGLTTSVVTPDARVQELARGRGSPFTARWPPTTAGCRWRLAVPASPPFGIWIPRFAPGPRSCPRRARPPARWQTARCR